MTLAFVSDGSASIAADNHRATFKQPLTLQPYKLLECKITNTFLVVAVAVAGWSERRAERCSRLMYIAIKRL